MGCASSSVARIALGDDDLHTAHAEYEAMQATLRQDHAAGTAPVEVVLLGDQAQAIIPRIEALRNDTRAQGGVVRVVRRTPTAEGLQETIVATNAVSCKILDVSLIPGQLDAYRGCLRHALAFVFVVDLAGYDNSDSSPTSLKNALQEFGKLCSTTWCTQGIPIILWFDNEDIFAKKLKYDSFSARFPDYRGEDDDADAARQYLLTRFIRLKTDRHGAIYAHFTSFQDKQIARVLFAAVQDILLQRIIEQDQRTSTSSLKVRRHRIFSLSSFRREKW